MGLQLLLQKIFYLTQFSQLFDILCQRAQKYIWMESKILPKNWNKIRFGGK